MILTDSHCHLAMAGETGEDALLLRARAEGVRGFLVPGTTLQDSTGAVRIAQRHADVWSAVGYHPHEAKDCDEAAFEGILALAKEERVAAIGEVGLDYHYMHSPASIQREVLMRHIALARERDLPLIIHNRESTADLLDLLLSEEASGARGVLHSYTDSADVARRLIDRGFFISFSGILTFRTAESLRETARVLPRESVLIETDTPYLAPVPHRGKKNEPAFVAHVAELLGRLWGVAAGEAARITTANFERAFNVTVTQ
jgi:TatD DNase family protein